MVRQVFDSIVTGTIVACALIVTGILIRREVSSASSTANAQMRVEDIYIKEWRAPFSLGQHLGSAGASVQLLELADFECPFCRSFYRALKAVRLKYPRQVELSFVHFPLQGHRFAMPAARVGECAANQERFEAMYEQLFEGQDEFGLKPWDDYASAAGVPDMAAFDACIKKTDPIPRVEEGKALGAKLDVKGTPTIIINGWMLGRPPTEEELDGMVKKILAGKSPVDGKS
jgi:protein-disulfide isomerase